MKTITLNNGVAIPQLGMGGFGQKADAIAEALRVGYRLIDTAAQYGNEEDVGEGIRRSGVPRNDIFLSTKLWTEDIRQHRTRQAFEESLQRLGVDYVDLYLIHWPAEGFAEAWLEMEKIYKEGLARAIGVSNCEPHHLDEIAAVGSVVPTVNQVESHPYFRNDAVCAADAERGIATEVWCPLGGEFSHLLDNATLQELAASYGKTAAQIVIRWHLQRGVILFPKSSHHERMISNLDVFSFELDEKAIAVIDGLDTGHRMGPDPDTFDF